MVEQTGIYLIDGNDVTLFPSAEDVAARVEGYDATDCAYMGVDGSVWRATVEGPEWGTVTLHRTTETRPDLVAQLRAAGYEVDGAE